MQEIRIVRNYLTEGRKVREESALLSLRPLAPSEAKIICEANSASGTVHRVLNPG